MLGTDYRFDQKAGRVLSAKHQRIAEIIHDYNPELELAWIPPENRSASDTKPFAVIHNQSDGQRYLVMTLREDEVDHRLLARIFSADMRRHNPKNVISEIEFNERAKRLYEAKKIEDEKQEKLDLAFHILKSKKHSYKHGGRVYR